MTLWNVGGRIVDDSEEGVRIPEYGSLTLPSGQLIEWGDKETHKLASYSNQAQFGGDSFQWDPHAYGAGQGPSGSYNVGYIPQLIDWADQAQAGTLQPYEREQYDQMVAAARGIPTRDISQLQAGYPREGGDLSGYLTPASPDAGAVMLALRDKLQTGQASDQERGLYDTFLAQMRDQNYRASVPQASDAFNPLGDQFFGALGVLGLGATGGLAAAPLFAGGAGLATTLGSIGTLAGIAGTGAGVLGQATDQDWLSKLGLGLSVAGGLAGGIGGLTNVFSGGVNSLSDAARLAQSAGKVTGALGRIPGADPLRSASSYLGLAGTLGQGASGVQGLLGAAQGVSQGATQGGPMDFDYSWDYGDAQPYDNWSWDATSGTAPTDAGSGGGGGWLSSVLGGLGSVGKFLGSNASWLGPAVSGLGSLGAGAIGADASRDASAAQTQALNRGLDLQTAQWLQTQANQAPWLQAGQSALGAMQQRAGAGFPQVPGATQGISGANYAMPSATPGWSPQAYAGYTPGAVPQASQYGYQGPPAVAAGDYRWTPGQGPQAADYRYTPGQTPDAAAFRSGPPQLYQGAMPGAQVSSLTGQQVLDQDPGYQFRQDEARRGLEASAAYRGSGMSGSTLGALGRQSSDLASQEYQNAWQRMMGANTEQYGRNWNQYLQNWNQGVTGTQLGLQTTAQNFGQAMSAAQLREQLQQVATQQGWSQAQTEAAFREQMAQQASQQGFSQALGAQGQQWQQGMAGQQFDWSRAMQEAQQREQGQQFGWQADTQAQQLGQHERQAYETDLYNRLMQQQQTQYGRDVYGNETEYQRQQQAYQQQMAQQMQGWNQYASLAGLGQVSTGQLGQLGQANAQQQASLLSQLGTAEGVGAAGEGLAWTRALGGATNNVTGVLAGLNR